MVITGDNRLTAEAICRSIGVFPLGEPVDHLSIAARDFVELSNERQRAFVSGAGGRVFSRAEPRHKQDIVRLLKELSEVVAMTGDGVSDAPALKLADIGVAMGEDGTEVAKESADMVLADDNFATIVAAVEEGRAIYANMRNFIGYMLSSNVGEVICIFLTAALGFPEGLVPVQLLWVNLVTDGPPATALSFNPPDPDIMDQPPRRSDDPLIRPWALLRYLVIGLYVGVATVGVFGVWYTHTDFLGLRLGADGHRAVTLHQLRHWHDCRSWKGFRGGAYVDAVGTLYSFTGDRACDYFVGGRAKASSLSMSVLVTIEMLNALNCLSETASLASLPPWSNPWLLLAIASSLSVHMLVLYVPLMAGVFRVVPLTLSEWALVLLFSAPVVLIEEALKFAGRLSAGHKRLLAEREARKGAKGERPPLSS